jgi:hypothetical protein
MFEIKFNVAFPGLGDAPLPSRPRATGLPPKHEIRLGLVTGVADDWWQIHHASDAQSVAALEERFIRCWNGAFLPVIEAAGDPKRLCVHLLHHATLPGLKVALDRCAKRLGDDRLVDALFDRAVELARRVEPAPLTPNGRFMMSGRGGLAEAKWAMQRVYQAWLIVAAIGRGADRHLESADRDRAGDALRWATSVYLPSPVDRGGHAKHVEASNFATWLGLDEKGSARS